VSISIHNVYSNWYASPLFPTFFASIVHELDVVSVLICMGLCCTWSDFCFDSCRCRNKMLMW